MKDTNSGNGNASHIISEYKGRKKPALNFSGKDSEESKKAYSNRFDVINPSGNTKPTGETKARNANGAMGASPSSVKSQPVSGDPTRVTSDNYQKVYSDKMQRVKEMGELRAAMEAEIRSAMVQVQYALEAAKKK